MHELHYYPGNASLFPHMLLRELGCPFELRLVDRDHDAQKAPAYLALNPHGKIPVLVSGGRPVYETCAIGLHLADAHPEAGLAPPVGHPERADYYRWMLQISNTLQAEFRSWFYPHEFVDDPTLADHAKASAAERLDGTFQRLAAQLGDGPWLLPSGFSAADLYLVMMTRWGRTLPRPAREIPAIGAHARRVLARPAVAKTFEVEGLAAPFV